MVIEQLTFDVDPAIREQWMAVEEKSWSRYLEQRPGFIKKELWLERGNPGQVHAIIHWESEELWNTVPPEDITRVDAEMGEWFRDGKMKVWEVLRES